MESAGTAGSYRISCSLCSHEVLVLEPPGQYLGTPVGTCPSCGGEQPVLWEPLILGELGQ